MPVKHKLELRVLNEDVRKMQEPKLFSIRYVKERRQILLLILSG